MKVNNKILLTAVLGCVWLSATVLGGRALLRYENAPGATGVVTKAWPLDSKIQPDKDRPTLVMAVHPQCPCTRASVDELGRVVAQVQNKACVLVLFFKPEGADSTWTETDLHRAVAQTPGVTIVPDIDGKEAELFGAETSGHVFLFDRDGRLLFNGGITASRGHSGDNLGESTIVSLLNNGAGNRSQTLVFGCSLHDRKQGKACLK